MFEEFELRTKELRDLLEKASAFDMINDNKELLIYNIDFHCGLRKGDAEEMFNRMYFKILAELRAGNKAGNTQFKN